LHLEEQQIIVLVALYAEAKKHDLASAKKTNSAKISAEIRRTVDTGKS
jgi:hypothetical protein